MGGLEVGEDEGEDLRAVLYLQVWAELLAEAAKTMQHIVDQSRVSGASHGVHHTKDTAHLLFKGL